MDTHDHTLVHTCKYRYIHICVARLYSLAVFVGWFVVVDWNSSLIFTLHQLIAILSHKLKHTCETRQIIQRWMTPCRIIWQFYSYNVLSTQQENKLNMMD